MKVIEIDFVISIFKEMQIVQDSSVYFSNSKNRRERVKYDSPFETICSGGISLILMGQYDVKT